jgi:broad specificity phosphatase PhoE
MPEILLVRHGKPQCDHNTKIRGCEFARWVAQYEDAPIDRSFLPSPELLARMTSIAYVTTSTLRRSVESASILAPGRSAVAEPLFNEAGIPTAIPFRIALSPGSWDALSRAAWLLRMASGDESFREAKVRAVQAAARLVVLARQHGSVALIGHGMLNTLIARALRASGWTGTGTPRVYWGSVALQNSATSA